ncbi:7343_t:CDS:2, partial [Cetraspora pellucida]
ELSLDQTYFPIRVGQKTCIILNQKNFYIMVLTGVDKEPVFLCKCETYELTASSASAVVSNVYQKQLCEDVKFYPTSCKVGTFTIFIYNIVSSTKPDWNYSGNGYQSLLMHLLEKCSALFILKIENDKCIIEIYQDLQIKRTIISSTPDL